MGCVSSRLGAGRPVAAVASYAPSQAVTDHVEQRRVQFGFEIAFSNGDGFKGRDCRLETEDDDVSDQALIYKIVRKRWQLMVGSFASSNTKVNHAPHKRVS